MAKSVWKVLRIINFCVGSITIIYGLFMFFWFYFGHQNYNNAVLALFTSINAFIMSHVLILKSLEKIFIWYEERIVRWIKHYGILSSLSSLVAITVYTYLGLQNHQRFDLQSFYTAACLAFIISKGSLTTFFVAHYALKDLKVGENIYTTSIIAEEQNQNSENPEVQSNPCREAGDEQSKDSID